jgi:hypothetical protein
MQSLVLMYCSYRKRKGKSKYEISETYKPSKTEPIKEQHPIISYPNSPKPSHNRLDSLNSGVSSPPAEFLARHELRRSRIRYPPGSHDWFIPRDALETVVTVSAVTEVLSSYRNLKEASENAENICKWAIRLFAILIEIKKVAAIMPLLKEGFTDHDLPAVLETRPFRLQSRIGGHVKTFEDWSDETLEDFDLKQWWMLAPFFATDNHYDLNDNTVLPFVPFEKTDRTHSKQGGYSEVFPFKIHPAHHDFWESSETTVCVFPNLLIFLADYLYALGQTFSRSETIVLLR